MVLGWFWTKCRAGAKNENFQKWPGVFFRSRGIKNTPFQAIPDEFVEEQNLCIFVYKLPINRLKRPLCYGNMFRAVAMPPTLGNQKAQISQTSQTGDQARPSYLAARWRI